MISPSFSSFINSLKKSHAALALCLLSSILFTGCGTTSGLQTNNSSAAADVVDKKYRTLIVNPVETASAQTDATPERVALAGKELRGMIVSQTRNTGAFEAVLEDGVADADTLVLDTEVTRYEDGNAVARLMIGFGAGSSRFDANFVAKDGATQLPIGNIFADKNSWLLGGGLAAGQDADSYVPGIAKKVATEIAPLGINHGE